MSGAWNLEGNGWPDGADTRRRRTPNPPRRRPRSLVEQLAAGCKRAVLFQLQSGLCCWCGEPMLFEGDCTLEHLVPRSRGGPDHKANCALAHEKCNSRRGNNLNHIPATAPLLTLQRLETAIRLFRDRRCVGCGSQARLGKILCRACKRAGHDPNPESYLENS